MVNAVPLRERILKSLEFEYALPQSDLQSDT